MWCPHEGISALIRRGRTQRGHVKTEKVGRHQQSRKRASPRTKSARTLTLDFLVSRTIQQMSVFKPPSLWDFATGTPEVTKTNLELGTSRTEFIIYLRPISVCFPFRILCFHMPSPTFDCFQSRNSQSIQSVTTPVNYRSNLHAPHYSITHNFNCHYDNPWRNKDSSVQQSMLQTIH